MSSEESLSNLISGIRAEPIGGLNEPDDAGSLLDRILTSIEDAGIDYLLIRNFENYPKTITGDIDLMIRPQNARRIGAVLSQAANDGGWRIARVIRRSFVISFVAFCPKLPPQRRHHLSFDCFINASWYGLDYLPFNIAWQRRQRLAGMWCLSDSDSALATLIHYLLYNKEVPEKYRSRISENLESSDDGNPFISQALLRTLVTCAKGQRWGDIESMRAPITRSITASNLINQPVKAVSRLASLVSRYAHNVARPEGSALVVRSKSCSSLSVSDGAAATLEKSKELHIFPSSSSAFVRDSLMAGVREKLVVLKGGLAIRSQILSPSDETTGKAGVVTLECKGNSLRLRLGSRLVQERESCTTEELAILLLDAALMNEIEFHSRHIEGLNQPRPRRAVIVLAGPDGSGKSTLASCISRELASNGVLKLHHRPHVFPSRKVAIAELSRPHGRKTYGKVPSFAKVAYLFLDYQFGWILRLRRRAQADARLIILERGWWDLAVDPRRYRLHPGTFRLVTILGRLLPSPDATVVLVGDPRVCLARKEELPLDEVSRQIEMWKQIANSIPGASLVDYSQSPEAICEAVVSHLTEAGFVA